MHPAYLCCPPAHQDAPGAKPHTAGILPPSRLSMRVRALLQLPTTCLRAAVSLTPPAPPRTDRPRPCSSHCPGATATELGASRAPTGMGMGLQWGGGRTRNTLPLQDRVLLVCPLFPQQDRTDPPKDFQSLSHQGNPSAGTRGTSCFLPPSPPAGLMGSLRSPRVGHRGPPIKDKHKMCWSMFTPPVQPISPLFACSPGHNQRRQPVPRRAACTLPTCLRVCSEYRHIPHLELRPGLHGHRGTAGGQARVRGTPASGFPWGQGFAAALRLPRPFLHSPERVCGRRQVRSRCCPRQGCGHRAVGCATDCVAAPEDSWDGGPSYSTDPAAPLAQ